jgi:hypothetical protein
MRGPGPGSYSTAFLARLKPGVTLQNAQRELDTIIKTLISEHPEDKPLGGLGLIPLKTLRVGLAGRTLWPLFGAALLFLIIACVNLAGLTLVRGFGRAGSAPL